VHPLAPSYLTPTSAIMSSSQGGLFRDEHYPAHPETNSSIAVANNIQPYVIAEPETQPSPRRGSIARRVFRRAMSCLIPDKIEEALVPGMAPPGATGVWSDFLTLPMTFTLAPLVTVLSEDHVSPPASYPAAGRMYQPSFSLVCPSPGPWGDLFLHPHSAVPSGGYTVMHSATGGVWISLSAFLAGRSLDPRSFEPLELQRMCGAFCCNDQVSEWCSANATGTEAAIGWLPPHTVLPTSTTSEDASSRFMVPFILYRLRRGTRILKRATSSRSTSRAL